MGFADWDPGTGDVLLGRVAADADDAGDTGEDDAGDTGEDDVADEAAEADDDGDDDAGPAEGLPEDWPAELAVHDGVEIANPIVEDDDDGEVFLIQAQYRTDEEIEEAVAYFEGLEGDGWELVRSSGVEQEGMAESAEAELEGFGWNVGISADRLAGTTLYTYTLQPAEEPARSRRGSRAPTAVPGLAVGSPALEDRLGEQRLDDEPTAIGGEVDAVVAAHALDPAVGALEVGRVPTVVGEQVAGGHVGRAGMVLGACGVDLVELAHRAVERRVLHHRQANPEDLRALGGERVEEVIDAPAVLLEPLVVAAVDDLVAAHVLVVVAPEHDDDEVGVVLPDRRPGVRRPVEVVGSGQPGGVLRLGGHLSGQASLERRGQRGAEGFDERVAGDPHREGVLLGR